MLTCENKHPLFFGKPLLSDCLVVENPRLTDARCSACVIVKDLEDEGSADEKERRSLKMLSPETS